MTQQGLVLVQIGGLVAQRRYRREERRLWKEEEGDGIDSFQPVPLVKRMVELTLSSTALANTNKDKIRAIGHPH
jgi:hypothetical protein